MPEAASSKNAEHVGAWTLTRREERAGNCYEDARELCVQQARSLLARLLRSQTSKALRGNLPYRILAGCAWDVQVHCGCRLATVLKPLCLLNLQFGGASTSN